LAQNSIVIVIVNRSSGMAKGTVMTKHNTADADLHWDVLTITRPGLTRDLPAGKEKLMWVANSSILIYGKHDAVLVDTFLTEEQSQKLVGLRPKSES